MAFIIVASCSKQIIAEWKKINPRFNAPDLHQDYALLKVLYHLRRYNSSNTFVNHIQWTGSQAPLNFNALTQDDIIYIAGHGNEYGLYAMGPNLKESDRIKNMDRLIDILTRDGSLKKKVGARKEANNLKVILLSCRAGLGFHGVMALRLYNVLGKDLTVEGAIGFTFGSPRTLSLAYNEVLIKGLPWHMEYPGSITLKEAEQETSSLEKKSITYKRKKKEIDAFVKAKTDIETKMKALVGKIKNTEINKALDELFTNHNIPWGTLVSNQFDLYSAAKLSSSLEFDMWFPKIYDGYVRIAGSSVWAQGINIFLKQAGVVPSSILTVK